MMQSDSVIEEKDSEVAEFHLGVGIGIPQIPFDLFAKKTRKAVRFTDAFQNLVYKSPASQLNHNGNLKRVLFDASGNSLISLLRACDGSWEGQKGNGSKEELLFRVERTLNTFSKAEFNVLGIKYLTFAMRGCCFWRSCTIYQHDNSLVAQTNLMYTLGFRKHFVSRGKFRVTIFPGFADYTFIAALILVFLKDENNALYSLTI